MASSTVRRCPICEVSEAEILHSQKFALPEGHPLSAGYNVVCCVECGFVYADTAATHEDYDRFYAQFSKYEDQQTTTGVGGVHCGTPDNLRDAARQIASFLPDNQSRIIDMGCANGGLLKFLKELGFNNVCGIDPSPTCVENVRRLGVEAHVGSLFQQLREIGRFDCVILSHVLEHVQDLKRATHSLHALTTAGGYVYIEVPNANRYADNVFAPFQDFNTEHINHFSGLCLSNLMQPAGFCLKEQGEKVIELSSDMPYPALYSIWIKGEQRSSYFALRRDGELELNIRAYIEKSQLIMQWIETKLRHALGESDRFIVWGTGQLAMKLLIDTSLRNAVITAFVDGNPMNQGKRLLGIPILPPEQIRPLPHPIIIATTLHQQEIAQKIQSMGLPNRVILLG